MRRKKLVGFCLALLLCLVNTGQVIQAFDPAVAAIVQDLGTTDITISDFVDEQYVVDIAGQMTDLGYHMTPDECYQGYLKITNDQSYEVTIQDLKPYTKINKSLVGEDYEQAMDTYLLYSFAIDSKGIAIPDTAVGSFPEATLVDGGTYLSSEGGTVDFGDSVTLLPGESITLYYDFSLVWFTEINVDVIATLFTINLEEIASYNITTSVVNGTIDETVTGIASGASKTINYTADTGYVLDSVLVDGVEQNITTYANSYTFSDITTNHTIQVVYEPESYTIDYELDEGIAPTTANPIGYDVEDTFPIAIINEPTKDGYTFAGWTVDYENDALMDITDATKNYSVPDGTTGDIALTAVWTVNSYVLDFDLNGTSAIGKPENQILMYGAKATEPSSPTRQGYRFAGWYEDEECINSWDFTTETMPASNKTLYAKWVLDPKDTPESQKPLISNESKEVLATGDISNIEGYIMVVVMTAGVYMLVRKKYSK